MKNMNYFNSSRDSTTKNTEEEDLRRVKRDGLALQFVKEQTPEICLAAVEDIGLALDFVKEQTPEICLAAVQQSFVRQQLNRMGAHFNM